MHRELYKDKEALLSVICTGNINDCAFGMNHYDKDGKYEWGGDIVIDFEGLKTLYENLGELIKDMTDFEKFLENK